MLLTNAYLKKVFIVCIVMLVNQYVYAQTPQVIEKSTTKQSVTVTIESQVKGSQEQPNVIYIMPWQGISHPVTIKDNKHEVVLPQFKPITPKIFKQQLNSYYQQQKLTHSSN